MEPHHVQAQVCQVEMWHCCRGFSMPTKTSGAEPASQQEKSLLCYSPESWGGTKRRWTCLRQTWSSSKQWSLCSGDQKKADVWSSPWLPQSRPDYRRQIKMTCDSFVGWQQNSGKILMAGTQRSHIFSSSLPRTNVSKNCFLDKNDNKIKWAKPLFQTL